MSCQRHLDAWPTCLRTPGLVLHGVGDPCRLAWLCHPGRLEARARHDSDRLQDVAYHVLQGPVRDDAVARYRQAAEQAAANGAYRQAVAYFEQAISSIEQRPRHADTQRQTIDLQFDLSNALLALGYLARASGHLREAASLAETLDDGRRLGQACALLPFAYGLAGAYQRANAAGRRAMAVDLRRGHARLDGGHVSIAIPTIP